MKKLEDLVYPLPYNGKCNVKIYHSDTNKFVLVCMAVPDNYGTSTTNYIEYIYAEIKTWFLKKYRMEKIKGIPKELRNITKEIYDECKSSKGWAVALYVLMNSHKYVAVLMKSLSFLRLKDLTVIDFWPKGTGLRPEEDNYAWVVMHTPTAPEWAWLSKKGFTDITGLDVRYMRLELEEIRDPA